MFPTDFLVQAMHDGAIGWLVGAHGRNILPDLARADQANIFLRGAADRKKYWNSKRGALSDPGRSIVSGHLPGTLYPGIRAKLIYPGNLGSGRIRVSRQTSGRPACLCTRAERSYPGATLRTRASTSTWDTVQRAVLGTV